MSMWKNLTIEQLKDELTKRGLDTKGTKADMETMLEAAVLKESDVGGKGNQGDVENKSDDDTLNGNVSYATSSSEFKVRDINNLIQLFSGDGKIYIKTWIKEFEEIASMLNWNDIEKFVYAKRQLVGSAKIFVRTITCKSYTDLKLNLIKEFDQKVCKADIYLKLQNRSKKKSETFREYLYKMQELASLADVDELSLVNFIINGIGDKKENKMILYSATNISELKDKLEIYERMKQKSSIGTFHQKPKPAQDNATHCFNCGSSEHKRKDCKATTKCFKCNGSGHISKNCQQNTNNKQTNCIFTQNVKDIKINNHHFNALVDTGSDLSLIRKDSFQKLKNVVLVKNSINLLGLGTGKSHSIGHFEALVSIDNIEIRAKFNVVPTSAIRFPCIIGNNIISKVKVVIDRNITTFYSPNEKLVDESATIMNICIDDRVEVDAPTKFKDEINNIISNYSPHHSIEHPVKMSIVLNDETPLYSRPRRLPNIEKEVVKKQVEDWLKEGIIQPSKSPFASNVVVVKKKDGNHRVCIDFRRINKVTVKEPFPMPVIEDVLDKLSNTTVFTTLDLKNVYFHVPLDKDSMKYTAFITEDGHFEFTVIPFGLTNAPAVFCRFINFIFRDLIAKKVIEIFIDDIIILSENEEENMEKLKTVLEIAAQYGLKINWKKCKFLKHRIEFLGHIVQNGTISPSDEKVKAVKKFPEPKNLKDVQSFLGLTGAFRRFIQNYSLIARPLTNLLKKDKNFKIQAEERSSIQELKVALTNKPVLHIFKPKKKTEVHTDASKHACAAILLQLGDDNQFHPVYYYSRKNLPAEEKYHSYILEVMAVYLALKKFRIYLLGINFKVVTDCVAFRQTKEKKDLPVAVSRWILYMQEFDFEVEHRIARRMLHVDSLSRHPVIYTIHAELLIRIQKAQENDDHIKAIKELLKQKSYDEFFIEKNILFKYVDGKKLLVVPRSMEAEIIKMKHEEGHFASLKTIHLINQEFYIFRIQNKVQNCIENCVKCLLGSRKAGKQEGLLNPIDKGDKPLSTMHLDHVGPMDQTAKQYKYMLTIIDGFSKYVWIYPVKTLSCDEVIRKLKDQQQYFGNPGRIITDRGSAFTATDFKQFCENEGIEHILITAGVPRGNGQIERINRIIIESLRKLTVDSPEKWYKFVPKIQVALNSTFQRSIQRSPFEVLFGVKMNKKDDLNIVNAIEQASVVQYDDERDKVRQDEI